MTEEAKTWAQIAIFEADDNSAFGLGCELKDNITGLYHIFSLYLPADEYPNKRQILHRTIPKILAEVPDDYVAVTFNSSLLQFRNRLELARKMGVFAPGKFLNFRTVRQVRHEVVSLAIDAVERKSSIQEKL
jgi:hypothetical protein